MAALGSRSGQSQLVYAIKKSPYRIGTPIALLEWQMRQRVHN
jgi:hypothetical protein